METGQSLVWANLDCDEFVDWRDNSRSEKNVIWDGARSGTEEIDSAPFFEPAGTRPGRCPFLKVKLGIVGKNLSGVVSDRILEVNQMNTGGGDGFKAPARPGVVHLVVEIPAECLEIAVDERGSSIGGDGVGCRHQPDGDRFELGTEFGVSLYHIGRGTFEKRKSFFVFGLELGRQRNEVGPESTLGIISSKGGRGKQGRREEETDEPYRAMSHDRRVSGHGVTDKRGMAGRGSSGLPEGRSGDIPLVMSHDPKTPMVLVEGVRKAFGDKPVLKGVSFQVDAGDLVSIIGPSGCGKSTLLRCLNGLETMDAGRVTVAGLTLEQDPAKPHGEEEYFQAAHRLRSEVGMVFQSFNLFPHKTILENITLAPVTVKGESRKDAEGRAEELLRKVGLEEFGDRYPEYLSGGQKQRAAIARALAMSPKVMLYDEPTSALDPELVDEVLAVMKELDREGMTQIVVTHEIRFARDASDTIIYMEQGEIVEESDEDAMFSHPKDERTRRFLRKFL